MCFLCALCVYVVKKPLNSLMKRVALVTGGSRGIGLGIATHLAKNGFDVAINGVREEGEVRDAVKTLKDEGSRVVYCRGNIAQSADRLAIMQKVREQYGRL